MKIKNLHQPYIFKKNNQINLIVSEFLPDKLNFYWGDRLIQEDYWKLCHLDSDFKKTTINTPPQIIFEEEIYHVVQECNGFIDGDKISYVIGGHTKKDQDCTMFFLVQGDFDFDSKKVKDVVIKDRVMTGFLNDRKVIPDVNTKKILENNLVLLDYSEYFDELIRIIPVFGKKLILITGYKENNFQTIVLDLETKGLQRLEGLEKKYIYKSSILNDGEDKMFAFTEKTFQGDSKPDYLLNIENDFLLKNI